MIIENRIIIEGKVNRENYKNVRPKRKRNGSFRIVSDNENKHVIEKKKKFFCWKWWSRSYLYDIKGCYVVEDKDTAKRIVKILTENK